EVKTANNPKQLLELESSLAESQQACETLEGELKSARRELQALRCNHAAKESELEARTRELQASQAEVEQWVQTLTEAMAAETNRRQSAEQQAGSTAKRQSEL